MRSRSTDRPGARLRRGALAVAVGAATGLAGMGAGTAAASPDLSAQPLASPGQVVTLITGDRVVLHGNGTTSVLPATGSTGSLESYTTGTGDRYFIPTAALPYLSGELDPSLFDATALTAAGATSQIPLRLSFVSGATPTAPAGITLGSVTGSTATGYLTPASGPAFVRALRADAAADRAAGKPAGSTPLVPGLTSISLAGASTAPVATPHYPLHILQINATDLTGKPAQYASLLLVDADNVRTETALVPLDNGIGKVAVPTGTYRGLVDFADIDANGNYVGDHTVVQDMTVPSTGNATATVSESAATAQVGVSTPKPTTPALMAANYVVTDAQGNATSFTQLDFGPPPPTFVSPVAPPAIGKIGYQIEWAGTPTDATQNYRFDVAFGSANGIPANLHDTVTQNQVSTVHDRFSADPARKEPTGSLLVGAIDPTGGWIIGNQTTMPGDLTDYLASNMGNVWEQDAYTASSLVFNGDGQTYVPGRQYSVDWAHGPLAPNLGQHTGQQFCRACVAGSTIELGVNPVGDSDPSHAGALFVNPASSHFTLYRDGTKVFDQDGYDGAELDNVPAGPATYRAVFDLSLAGLPGIGQSAVTHTDITVPDNPAAKGSTPPAEIQCAGATASTPCVVLPVLDLNYRLATDENNSSTSPVQVLDLRVGHVSYDGAGSHSLVTKASVSVSFDNGATWQSVPTVGFAGNYVAFWPNKAGTSPSIKVTASDANGGSITQTVSSAYTAN